MNQEREALLQSLREAAGEEQTAQGVQYGKPMDTKQILREGVTEAVGGFQGMAEAAGESIGLGVASGAASVLESAELVFDDIRNAVGLIDPKLVGKTEQDISERRDRRKQAMDQTKNPGIAKAAELATQAIPLGGLGAAVGKASTMAGQSLGMVPKAARALGSVASGAATGAVVDEESRGRGALTGAALGYAANKVAQGVRGIQPERVRPEAVGAKFDPKTMDPSATVRMRTLGRDPRYESHLFAKQSSKASKVPEDVNLADEFKNIVKSKTDQVNRVREKLYSRALKSPKVAGIKADLNKELGPEFKQLRQNILDADIASGRNFVKKIDKLFDEPVTLQTIHDTTKTGNQLSNFIKTIKNNDEDAYRSAVGLKSKLVNHLKDRLNQAGTKEGSSFAKGKAISSRRYEDLETIGAKEVDDLDLDTIVSKLVNKESGGENYKKALYGLVKDKRAANGLIVQKLFNDAAKGGVFNSKKFMQSISKLRVNSKIKFDPTTQKAADNLSKLQSYIEANKDSLVDVAWPATKLVKHLGHSLMSTKAGIKLSSKLSPKNPQYRAIVNALIGIASGKISNTEREPQGAVERQALIEALKAEAGEQ